MQNVGQEFPCRQRTPSPLLPLDHAYSCPYRGSRGLTLLSPLPRSVQFRRPCLCIRPGSWYACTHKVYRHLLVSSLHRTGERKRGLCHIRQLGASGIFPPPHHHCFFLYLLLARLCPISQWVPVSRRTKRSPSQRPQANTPRMGTCAQ